MSIAEPNAGHRRARVTALVVAAVLALALVVGAVISTGWGSGNSTATHAPSTSPSPSSPTAVSPSAGSPGTGSTGTGSPSAGPATPPGSTEPQAVAGGARPTTVDPLTKKPVITAPLGERASVIVGVTATVSELTAVTGEAHAPGDIAGPSVRFALTITNNTASAVSLSSAVINLFYGTAMTPASSLPGPNVVALPESLGTGQTATAHLVFSVPASERKNLTINLDYSTDAPLIAFSGPGPAA